MTRTISGDVVRLGLVGADGVRPYDVLVLFISLAYISTALDSTGALRALSFLITQKAARAPRRSPPSAEKIASGPKLYSLLYGFWFLAGIVVGNDPIILSGTAFLAYFTQHSGITDSTAWTFSQFISANVASAVLVSSNPTNVLLAGAFKLNFLTDYTAFTILPSVLTALVAFPLTYFTFILRHPSSRESTDPHARSEYIPAQILPPDINPRSALLDPRGAVFHATLMLTTLAILVGTSFVPGGKVEVWMVTAAGGIIAFLRDIWSERNVKRTAAPTHSPDDVELDVAGATRATKSPPARRPRLSLPYLAKLLSERFPMTSSTISRLPLSLLPFAGGTFILARALTSLGWTSIWAGWLSKIATTPAHAVFFLGFFIPFVMCPLTGTNIGAAILMVQILTDDRFALSPRVLADPRIMKGAIFSTAMASNVGAISWTFSASLAGLLWNSILRQKGIRMNSSSASKNSKRTLVASDSDSDYASPPPKKRTVKAPSKSKAKAKVVSVDEPDVSDILALTREQLEDSDASTLVDAVIALQEEVVALQQRVVSAKKEAPAMTKEQAEKALDIQRKLMVKGISKQMGWKPSAKGGAAKFTHTHQLPRLIFLALFNLPSTFKKKSAHKLTIAEFKDACGDQGVPTGKVRYNTLGVTGGGVNIRWNEEESSATVSGTYGLGGVGAW
ncbi:hypothetical protein RQP46_010592 [Phenoliferia psychrophenolica]